MPADILGFAYAATVAAGGIVGYAKAGLLCGRVGRGEMFRNPPKDYFHPRLLLFCSFFVLWYRFRPLAGSRSYLRRTARVRCAAVVERAAPAPAADRHGPGAGRYDGVAVGPFGQVHAAGTDLRAVLRNACPRSYLPQPLSADDWRQARVEVAYGAGGR